MCNNRRNSKTSKLFIMIIDGPCELDKKILFIFTAHYKITSFVNYLLLSVYLINRSSNNDQIIWNNLGLQFISHGMKIHTAE